MLNLPEQLAGVKVFPCQPGDKLPALDYGWQTRATNDPAQLAQWDAGMPNLNWGVAAGPSGLFVFDIDPAGFTKWEEIQNAVPGLREAIAAAFTVRTPRGGYHYYFRGQGPTTVNSIAPGIDTRGGYIDEKSGKLKSVGYVVAPGSKTVAGPKTVDGEYTALGGQILPMPAPVLQVVPERKRGVVVGLDKDVAKDNPRNIQTARDLLGKYVADGRVSIEGAGGDNTCYQVVASILDKGISPGTAFELLEEMWNPHCSPPWEEWELEKKILNALEYGEETNSGAKGFQDNATAFESFAGQDFGSDPAPEKRSRFKPMLLSEARRDVRPASWLVPGMIPSHGVGILYGLSGSYKTFVALDWALSLAHGVSGQWGTPPVKHKVLFLAGESAYDLQEKRVNSWCEWQGVDPNDGQFVIVRGVPGADDKEGWEEIRQGLAELDWRPEFIAIDTLTRLMTGFDENSNNDAKRVLKLCEELSEHYGAFVLTTGHTGKDEGRGLRGAQVFVDNSDAVIYAKVTSAGTSLKVKKLKEVDIPAEPFYLEKTVFGDSIVLVRTNEAPAEKPKTGAPKTSWSDYDEIVARITKAGGKIGHIVLSQDIASDLGLEKPKVSRELKSRLELKDLMDGDFWVLPEGKPKLEFDL